MVISPVDLHRRHIVSFPEGAFTAASGKEIPKNVATSGISPQKSFLGPHFPIFSKKIDDAEFAGSRASFRPKRVHVPVILISTQKF